MRNPLILAVVVAVTCLVQTQTPPRDDRQIWNDNYAEMTRRGVVFQPNTFVAKVVEGRTPGTALDIAMGQGRNALMLAERGWAVTGFDISDVAISQATTEAKIRGLRLNAVVADGGTFNLGVERWDMVLSIYTGVTRVDDVLRSLKPEGIWVVEAFHRDTFGGGFRTNELFRMFENLTTVLYYEDAIGRPDLTWIYPPKDFRFVRLVARKEISK